MEKALDPKEQHPCGDLFKPTKFPVYNNTIFSRFFEVNDKAVMGWAENVLAKLEGNGILPTFINKKDNPDFKAFWGTVTHMFALVVLYARKYKEIDSNRILFELFIQDRGLVTALVDNQEQMEYLFYNYFEEYSKRGRLDIINTEGEILGELLRLIRYNSVDEFIFALLRPESTGWSMGYSSPTWDRTDTVMNVTKGFEYTLGVESLSNYPLLVSESVSITQDENEGDEIFNAMTFFGNQVVGIDGRVDRDKLIVVDPNMSYEISLQVKISAATDTQNLKFGVAGYETTDGDPMEMGVIENGQITGSSMWFHTTEFLNLLNEGIYYNIRGLILSNNEKFVDVPNLNFPSGRALSLMPTMKYIAPIFIQDRSSGNTPYVYVYDFKVKPLYLPFSQGYLGERDIIAAYYKNNSYQGKQTLENYLKKYLIGYKNIFGSELIRPYVGEESYRVLFKVFSNRNKYIPNAIITVFGQSLKTDVNGEATITLPRGQYLYRVEAENFEEVQNSLLVTEDVVEYIQLQGAAYERVVTFSVKDKNTKEPLSNVKLTFAGKTKYTQASGILTFDVFPGIYQYVAELEDYYTIRRTVEIVDSTNIVIEMEAIPYYNVTFRIRDGVDPVSGASVLVTGENINDQTGSSNAQGLATGFVLATGTYRYKVVKPGYITVESDFEIHGNAIIDVQFKPIPKYNITFLVKNNSLPVSKCNVTFNGATIQTDDNGRANFIEIAGTYNWKVSKTEFYAQEGSIEVVDQDIVKEINLVQIGYTIDFTVVDQDNQPLDGAQVIIGTEIITTQAEGTAQFVRISGSYNWTVNKEGYYIQQGVVIVNGANQTVKVTMKLITYNIVFTVRIDNQPIAGQSIVLGTGENEEILTTDGKGNATFNKVPGNYPWTISRKDYQIQTGTAVVTNQSIAIVVDLQKARGKLAVTVKDKESQALIDNAAVTINGQTKYTNVNGIAEMWDLVIGIWQWTCSKQDYFSTSGNVNIEERDDNRYTIYISQQPEPEFEVTFVAKEGYNFLSGATITLDSGQVLTTNIDGEAKVTLKQGSYNYRATYGTYYYDLAESFSVYSKTTVPLNFVRKTTTVTINVYDLNNQLPVSGASVSFNNSSNVTDGGGNATFYNVPLSSSSLVCTASKEPTYQARSESFVVDTDNPRFEIGLGANCYGVYFTVKDDLGSSVEGATIQLNSQTKYTTRDGKANFGPYLPGFSFNWQVFKLGYQSQNGSGSISNDDVYINLTLKRNICQVTYRVVDTNNMPVSGVTVEDNVSSGVTGSSGQVSWYVSCSESYSWTATSPDYFSERGSYSVGANETTKIILITMEGDGALLEVLTSSVVLPIKNTGSTGINNLRVSWGDGSQTLGEKSHTYSKQGTYRILFDFNGMNATLQWGDLSSNFKTSLIRVLKWFTSKVNTSWSQSAFDGCGNLTSIPGWTTSLMSGSTERFFFGCSSLRSIPRGCLSFGTSYKHTYASSGLSGSINLNDVLGGSNIESYAYCFQNTKNLNSVTGTISPSSRGCDLSFMFNLSNLSNIQANINAVNITSCEDMFSGCSNLSSPCTISAYSGGSFRAKNFARLSGITSIPSNVFSGSVRNATFETAFANCSRLSSIGSNLFSITSIELNNYKRTFLGTTNLLNISTINLVNADVCIGTFTNSGITQIPSNFFTSRDCSDYTACFALCKNLRSVGTSVTPNNANKIVRISQMFYNCTNLEGDLGDLFGYTIGSDGVTVTNGLYTTCLYWDRAFEGCSKIINYPGLSEDGIGGRYSNIPMPLCISTTSEPVYKNVIGIDQVRSRESCFSGCTGASYYSLFKQQFPNWF